jgi:small GTP-binding protein
MSDTPALPLIIAVVGHTNTGKTSLLRTLLRNASFGEVRDSAGTTRHVEAAQLLLQGKPYIELRDTPGLEDSVALAAHLKNTQQQGLRGRACLENFISGAQAEIAQEFEQEIKVLRQALECHAMLYVIDCREEVLEKYREEIATLSLASRPILPVLNFIQADAQHLQSWRAELAELGLHALVEFDTVAFDFAAEKRLYQKLQTLLETWYQPLQQLLDHRAQEWQQVRGACIAQVAKLLLDMATTTVAAEPRPARINDLQNLVRQREQQCLRDVLELLNFSSSDVQLANLPVQNGEWELDLFAPETLKKFGLDAASAAAAGAAVGAGVDLLLAGLSLGAASLTGAAIGTAWHTGRRYGKDLLARWRGEKIPCVDDTTLNILLLRQLSLLRHLFRRGHAALNPVQVEHKEQNQMPDGWDVQRRKMRELLQLKAGVESREYQRVIKECEAWLAQII